MIDPEFSEVQARNLVVCTAHVRYGITDPLVRKPVYGLRVKRRPIVMDEK